jgi:hypothetical protein
MIAKLRRIAIYDTSSNNLVVLTTIQEGVEGSGGFFYEEEEDTLTVDDDQAYLLSFLCRLETRVLGDSSARATLMAMVGNECIISGVGIDGFVQFGRVVPTDTNTNTFADTVKIVAVDQIDKSTVFRIVAQRRSTKAYINGIIAGGVGAFNSLLNVYNVMSGTGSELFGFKLFTTATGSITNTTSGWARQSVTIGAGEGIESSRFLFPFANIPVTLSFRNETNNLDNEAIIRRYTGTTTVTTQASNTLSDWSASAIGSRLSVTTTPDASTRWISALFGSAGGGVEAGFSLPALRVGALTTFERF